HLCCARLDQVADAETPWTIQRIKPDAWDVAVVAQSTRSVAHSRNGSVVVNLRGVSGWPMRFDPALRQQRPFGISQDVSGRHLHVGNGKVVSSLVPVKAADGLGDRVDGLCRVLPVPTHSSAKV